MEENYLKSELYHLIKSDDFVFDFLQNTSLNGLWYWDLEQPEFEWMNDSFWLTLGYDPNEKKHLSSEWQDIIFPDDLNVAIENFNKHCDNPEHPYDQIVRYKHANGSIVWIHCRGHAIRNEQGVPIRMLGAHTDITKQKLSEQKYKKSLEELDTTYKKTRLALEESEQLFELSPDSIIKVDINGNIIKANRQASALFGYTKQELENLNIEKLIPEATRKKHRHHIKDYFVEGGTRKMGADRGKLTAFLKSGESISVEITLNLIDTISGKQALATIRSIEEREQLVTALKKQIEENLKLERFAFVASHDLQEPLRKINAFTDILESRFKALDIQDEESLFGFSRLQKAAGRMRNMIKDTLKLSQISASSISLTSNNVDKILVETKSRLKHLINKNQVHIEVVNGIDVVYSDFSLMVQLLQNLLSNAIKFRNEKITPHITIRVEVDKTETKILFTDNGIGIPSEYVNEIFEPFIRLHSVTEYSGNGIGLAVCKQIMDIHNGEISCQSNVNEGVTFIMSFPNRKN